jgi:hypothetical protein
MSNCQRCGHRTYRNAEFCRNHSPQHLAQVKEANRRYRQTEKGKEANHRVYEKRQEAKRAQLAPQPAQVDN